MMRVLQTTWPVRWWTALAFALRGVRVSPGAQMIGPRSQFSISNGAIVNSGCVLRTTGKGVISLGNRVWLARDCEIETDSRVELGARTTVQRRCTINGATRVGADCIFAPDVFVSSGTHPFRDIPHLPIREQERLRVEQGLSLDRPVWIQDDCWIGVHAVIAPGVTVGKGSVVGANSVVTRDVPPYSVVAGSPARVIGQRLEWSPPARVDLSRAEDQPYVLSRAPLLVALRPAGPAEVLRATISCRDATSFRANGRDIAVTAAQSEVFLEQQDGPPFGATVSIEADFGRVEFKNFEWVRR